MSATTMPQSSLTTTGPIIRAPLLLSESLEALVRGVSAAISPCGKFPDPALLSIALRQAVSGERWLPPERRRVNHECYARHLLYADPDDRFSILSLVWNHGQESPIHGHHTWCAMAVYEGEFSESHYEAREDGVLVETHVGRREQGSVTVDGSTNSIHRVANRSDALAISIHIYGVGGEQVTTGINRRYPLVVPAL